jgi:fumarylacetoacetate (FAA) hydrolase family protein
MDLEEALQKIADLEAQKADVSRNFEAFRKLAKDKEWELTGKLTSTEEELKKELEKTQKEYADYQKSIEDSKVAERTGFLDKKVEEMSKGDKKRAEQIRAEYALLNMPEDNTDGIQARLDKANAILNVSAPTSPALAGWAGDGASGGSTVGSEELSPNVKALLAFEWIKV